MPKVADEQTNENAEMLVQKWWRTDVLWSSNSGVKENARRVSGGCKACGQIERWRAQKTAANPFFECRLLNLFRPLRDSLSPRSPFRSLAVGILTPSRAASPPSVLVVGLDSVELRSLKVESPE